LDDQISTLKIISDKISLDNENNFPLKKITPTTAPSSNNISNDSLQKEIHYWFFWQHQDLVPIVEFVVKNVTENCIKLVLKKAENYILEVRNKKKKIQKI
jgi:hypothetical protein